MELGLTFPLQRFLRRKPPDYGTETDRRFCWDLHVISLRGRRCLLAVHSHSRYTFVRYDVAPLQWADLPGLFRTGLTESLTAAGFRRGAGQRLSAAGGAGIPHPHPWAPGGGLSQRAWEDVLALDLCLDTERPDQPLLDRAVNTRPSRCAGSDGLGRGLERIAASLP